MLLPQNQHMNQMNNLIQYDYNHRVATERRNEGNLLNAVIVCFTFILNFPIRINFLVAPLFTTA